MLQTNTRDINKIQNITKATKIDIVSDGGMAHGYGSFGWIMEYDHNTVTGRGEALGQ